jgi:hypothetical protein
MHVPEVDDMVPHAFLVFWVYSHMVVLPFGLKKLHNKFSFQFAVCNFRLASRSFSLILLPYVIKVFSAVFS